MTTELYSNYRFATRAIHDGQQPEPMTGAVIPPIYQTSTFAQVAVDKHSGYEYSRTGNPTRTALEACLASLERAQFGLAFASGMAACDTVMRLLPPGSHVIVGNDVYGGTYRLFERVGAPVGLTFSYVDVTDPTIVAAALTPKTRMIWIETPTNPMLRLANIEQIAVLTEGCNVVLVVDSTFATPVAQQPLCLGADIVVHSTTKYLAGHSDVIGGAVLVDDPEIYQRLAFLQNAVGAVPGPFDCWLTQRGIKTLALRMQAHTSNAKTIARFLENHTAVDYVIYPGLTSHPQHALAKQQMRCFGGMITFAVRGGEVAARLVVESTQLFTLAESLGGVESLIELPAEMTHASTHGSGLEVPPNLIRLSVGIEDVQDLLADLDQALIDQVH
ncbi:MAG: cystathionine gamma-synthase [Anaerolineae bacterium]|nr:cystathionine gamma-synthase [Anaerolineae bacterium]